MIFISKESLLFEGISINLFKEVIHASAFNSHSICIYTNLYVHKGYSTSFGLIDNGRFYDETVFN